MQRHCSSGSIASEAAVTVRVCAFNDERRRGSQRREKGEVRRCRELALVWRIDEAAREDDRINERKAKTHSSGRGRRNGGRARILRWV
jgi:hypothetical protein